MTWLGWVCVRCGKWNDEKRERCRRCDFAWRSLSRPENERG